MAELKLCRICLNKDLKLYKMEQRNLKQYYEEISRSKIVKDELPCYFCFECAALLHKYHKFKEKCDFGQSTLKRLISSGFLNYYIIEDIRKNRSDLQPPTDYINIACSKRIKTIVIKHKSQVEPLEMENVLVNSLTDDDDVFKYEFMSDNDFTDDIMKEEDEKTENSESTEIVLKADSETKTNPVQNPDFTSNPVFTETNSVHAKTNAVLTEINTELAKTEPVLPKTEDSPSKNETIVENLFFESDLDDSSADMTFDIDIEIAKINDKATNDRKKTVSTRASSKKTAGKNGRNTKKDKKMDVKVKVRDTDSNHKFVGIIREPKGELSKGNWETKLLTEDEAMEQFRKKEFDNKYERMEFKCTKCFKGFSKNEMLLRHNKMWHDQGENECRFCHMQFKWKSKLQIHMMNHYYIYKCLRCGLQFYLKNGAVFHDGHHNGVIHKCKHCGEEYTHVAVFHDSHHNGVIHKCTHCGEEYTHISTYYTHLRTSHRNAHACKICGATFVSQAGVVVHMKRKHVMHTQSNEEPTNIYCQKCEMSFVSQSAYDEHLTQSKQHEEENKDFKRTRRRRREILANASRCIHCNKKFRSKTEVKAHISDEHPGQNKVERVVCEICGAVLSSAYIEIHMNRHTRKKVYPCQTCGKEFLCATSHNTHQLTHSGEKPHPCPICPKRFGLKGHMEVHYKRVHLKEPYPKSIQKPKLTDCPVCHKTFQSRSHMDTHLRRVHLKEPYPKSGPKLCPICSKPFAYTSDMDIHYRRVHLKEPYPKRTYNRKNRNRQPSELEVPLYASLPK